MKNVTQTTVFKNEKFANYNFVRILLRILQFSQNTKKPCMFLRKIQLKISRKVQGLLYFAKSLYFAKTERSKLPLYFAKHLPEILYFTQNTFL